MSRRGSSFFSQQVLERVTKYKDKSHVFPIKTNVPFLLPLLCDDKRLSDFLNKNS